MRLFDKAFWFWLRGDSEGAEERSDDDKTLIEDEDYFE